MEDLDLTTSFMSFYSFMGLVDVLCQRLSYISLSKNCVDDVGDHRW